MIRTVQVPKRILKEYKELDVNSLKLYFYFLGKIQSKYLKIKQYADNKEFADEEFITITYKELAEFLNVCRLDRDRLLKPIAEIEQQGLYTYIELNKKDLVIYYNNNVYDLLVEVNTVASNNVIDLLELSSLKDKYSINLYLFCLTVVRFKKDKGRGSIKITIDNIKEILCRSCKSSDVNFYKAFITKRVKQINKHTEFKIEVKRSKSILEFKVKK